MKTTVDLTKVVLVTKPKEPSTYMYGKHKGEPRKWFYRLMDELEVDDKHERLWLFQFRWMCELIETIQLNFDGVATEADRKFALPACVIVRNKLVDSLHHMDSKILPHAEPVTLVKDDTEPPIQ